MARYVLLNETGETAESALAILADMPDVTVLDRTDDRAMLVEASPQRAAEIGDRLTGWAVKPEIVHDRPAPPFPRKHWKL
jgi:hypothetical protein